MTKAELLAALKDVPDDTEIFVTDDAYVLELKDVEIEPRAIWLLIPSDATLAPNFGKDRTLEWCLWHARHRKDDPMP